jgi:hypothetical protein
MARASQVQAEDKQEVAATEVATPEQRRRERRPFGVPRSKLSVAKGISGYHLHWVNDDAGRIFEAEEGGYEFVSPEEVGRPKSSDGKVKQLVGKKEDGTGLFAYLMKIREEWYLEDQQEIQSSIDRVENAIKRGTFEENTNDRRYVPKQGISIR